MIKKLLATLGLVLALYAPAVAGLIFDGTADSVHYGDIPSIDDATTLSGSCWVYNDNVTQDHFIGGQRNAAGGILWLFDDIASTSGRTDTYNIRIEESAGAGGSSVKIEGAISAGAEDVWEHVAFTFIANTNPGLQLFISGSEDANSDVDTTGVDDAGKVGENIMFGESVNGSFDRLGRLAECAFWNVVLTDPEIVSLSKAFSPSLIRPSAVIFYPPMIGKAQQDNDLTGNGAAPTYANQTASTPHPRVLR